LEDTVFVLYLLLWLIFSLRISVDVMVVGVIISAVVYWFACAHMRYNPATDYKLVRKVFLGIRYAVILVWETAKATVIVFRIVFSRKIVIEPQIVYFRTALKSNVARVALAISIGLTPGNIVVTLEDDLFCMHCLDRRFAERAENSVFVRTLLKFEE
jgi:multicomponent Na+:H+ antiporter subunit E